LKNYSSTPTSKRLRSSSRPSRAYIVVDIRLVPQSRFFPEWRKGNLENVFDDDYLHVRDLGNKGFKEKRIEIADLDRGLAIVKALGRNVVLLCACKYVRKCHRETVAEAFRVEGYEVKEWP
jgi:uncharacterized protein (DUF488 family)